MAAPDGAVLASAVVFTVLEVNAEMETAPVALIELLPETWTKVLVSTTETANAASVLVSLPEVGARLFVIVEVLAAFSVTSPLLVIDESVTLCSRSAGRGRCR